MARQGRFGQTLAGTSNLSAAIRSLVSQQLAAEEQTLFRAFYDKTPYGGSVPEYDDLVSFVNNRISLVGSDPAQVSYYDNLLGQAQKFQVQENYKGLKNTFYSTNGSNYKELASFLQGEGAEYGSELYSVTKDYITNFLADDLARDDITRDQFVSMANTAVGYFVDNQDVYDDVKYSLYETLFKRDSNEQEDLLKQVNSNDPRAVLNANKNLLAFYKGWSATLNSNGIAGDLLDVVKNSISGTATAIQDQSRTLANTAAANLLAGRKNAYDSAQATLDAFAREIAPSLGIDSSSKDFSFEDIPAVTMAAALSELGTEAQSQVRKAIDALNNASTSYAQTLRAQGNTDRANSIQAVSTKTKLLSGQDISFERYIEGSDKKDALMALADGIPSDEIYINQEWVRFLRGQNSSLFGDGIVPSDDLTGEEVARNILTEADAIDSALKGNKVGIIPKTWADDYNAAQRSQLGLSGEVKDYDGISYTGDNRYTAAELSNIEKTVFFDKKVSSGEMVIKKTKNADGTTTPSYIDAGVPSPIAGILYRIEKSLSGKNITVAYEGIPIYAAVAGNVNKKNKWGYVYQTKSGNLYADSTTGAVYSKPPIDVSKLRVSGSLAVSGENALITSDVDQMVSASDFGTVKVSGNGVQAELSDYVEPAALTSLKTPNINPYAKVSPSDPRIQGANGIIANLQNIADSIADEASKSLVLTEIASIKTNLANLSTASEDSGVRTAMMNAEISRQKAEALKANPPASVKAPTSTERGLINPFSPVQSGGGQKIGEPVFDLGFIFREIGKVGGAIGQGAIQAGGALAHGIPSVVGGALSAGINTILPGIPGAGGAGATSGQVRPLTPAGQVAPLFSGAPKPIGTGTSLTESGLALSGKQLNDFRAGERAAFSAPIVSPKTTTPPVTTRGR
jgi:hypothetical protein